MAFDADSIDFAFAKPATIPKKGMVIFMANVYKSKKGIMPAGLLAIAVAVSIAGCLLSFVYLKINQVCPSAYLCGVIAFGFGAAMGGIAYILIRVMKIRSKTTALVGMLIGCLVFTIFKWALYVQWDNEKIYDTHKKAWHYCEFYCDFTMDGKITSEPMTEEQIESIIGVMKEVSAYEYLELTQYPDGASAYIKDLEEYNGKKTSINELKDTDSFEWFYGDYVNKGDEAKNILKAYEMDSDEYFEYLGKYPSVIYLITHPGEFWENIKTINSYGRWTISSSSSSSSTTTNSGNTNVKGIALWIVWFCEILVICIPALVIACKRAGKPFIEFENDWAELNESDAFMLRAPNVPAVAGTAFKANPDSIFMYEHLLGRPGNAPYMKLKLYHSKQYDENYACLSIYTFVPKNKNYSENMVAKYIAVDKDFVYRFYQHCGLGTPFAYTPAVATPTMQAASDPMNILNGSMEEVKAMSATSGAMDELVAPAMADEKSQDDVLNELNS